MPILFLLVLIICNVIWAINPVVGKELLTTFTTPQVAWLRYSSALLGLIVMMRFKRTPVFVRKASAHEKWLLTAMGLSTFFVGPWIGIYGLSQTHAVDNALIIGMEPMVTVALALLFLKSEKWRMRTAFSFALAFSGFCLLTRLTPERIFHGWDSQLIGNVLILLSLVAEALFSVITSKLSEYKRYESQTLFASALAVGVVALSISGIVFGLSTHSAFFPELSQMTLKNIGLILWIGPLGTAATYWFWMVCLRSVAISVVALTLFVQPLCGALAGHWILAEPLGISQIFGGLVILAAVLLQSAFK